MKATLLNTIGSLHVQSKKTQAKKIKEHNRKAYFQQLVEHNAKKSKIVVLEK